MTTIPPTTPAMRGASGASLPWSARWSRLHKAWRQLTPLVMVDQTPPQSQSPSYRPSRPDDDRVPG